MIIRLKPALFFALTSFSFVACVHTRNLIPTELTELVREPASVVVTRSGYAIGTDMCGSGSLSFPRLAIDTRPGYCVGLVASAESGMIFPRTIQQVPGRDQFLVVDMGGWNENKGRVYSLDRDGVGYKLRILLDRLDQPHGLQFGADRKAYVGTLTEIFRFDPLAVRPEQTKEVVLRGFEGRTYRRDDGFLLDHNSHPLKQFIFDREGNLYVNIGAPSDACVTENGPALVPANVACRTSEGARASAAIWKFKPQVVGQPFRTLRAGEANPPYEILARGLRNSMALAMHPDYPRAGTAFFQGENSRDIPNLDHPYEELNLIEAGKHYGWPYCYNAATTSPDWRDFVAKPGPYQNICQNQSLYRAPYSVLPPHSAPLGMLYYSGQKFSELRNNLVIGLHGYNPAGNRIVFAPVDANGFPTRQTQATTFRKNCEGSRFSENEDHSPVGGVQFQELITGWYAVPGVRPIGAPVGMTVAEDGAIWVIEDKNRTILRIDVDPTTTVRPMAACNVRSEAEIAELIGWVAQDAAKTQAFRDIRVGLVESKCIGCHAGFNLREFTGDAARDREGLRFMLGQDGWIEPNDHESSHLYRRTHVAGPERPMPDDAAKLLRDSADYRALIAKLDNFVDTLVPGERALVSASSSLRIRNQNRANCGSLPVGAKVIVLERSSRLDGFVRIYKPMRKYLTNGCAENDQFFVGSGFIRYTPQAARTPQSVSPVAQSFVSRRLTAANEFTFGIEGPAFSSDGSLYVVNFKKQGTVGRVNPATGKVATYLTLPKGSIANSIRFNSSGQMFLADYKAHRIWSVDSKTKALSVFSENKSMSQPNDFAIAKSGAMFVSDPNWKKKSGQLWSVNSSGSAVALPLALGTVNGIDLSPDDKTLYVGESSTNTVWAFAVNGSTLSGKRLVIKFEGHEIDGLKTDVDGNLYVSRIGKGTIAVVSPAGVVLREVTLLGKNPTNLTFGGVDGRDVFVTQRDGGFVETFRTERPGRDWLLSSATN